MIRRSPAELYLKYLLLVPTKHDNKRVMEICSHQQIDTVGSWYLDKLRGQLHPPKPFRPRDVDHAPSQRYIMLEGVHRLFHFDDTMEACVRFLEKPRIKEFIESMALLGAPASAIAQGIQARHNHRCKARDIERFLKFFWDINLLDSTEMRAIIEMRKYAVEQSDISEIRDQYQAVKQAFWSDPRRIAADLPSSPVTALIAQMKMGLMPSKLDTARVLQSAMQVMSVRVLEMAINNGPKDSMKVADYANAMRAVRETLEGIVKPDEELQKQLRSISLRTDSYSPPMLHVLSGGRHTAELAPLGGTIDATDNYDGDQPVEAGE